jgi:hypothetical protein
VPAAAVIPAPIAYIKVVAVKKLVVGFLARRVWPASKECVLSVRFSHPSRKRFCPLLGRGRNLDLLL